MDNARVQRKNERRFGFIRAGTVEFFYHEHDLVGMTFDELNIGDRVTFDPITTAKGLRASNVRRLQEVGRSEA